jgi:alkanesulfonate monooxygenase SsuD/methylene tetrahydromethanopterin reductase-like flavin-dependent oxidoreductase (luciferase family)
MRLGLFMMPLHPPGPPMHVHIDQDTRKSLLLEELGYDELWLGEHFSATSEPYPSPLMFMANLIPQTKNIKFATGVINLPNRHPAVVAGEIAQFDHLSRGRLIFGAGTGSLGSDYELFQVGDAARRQRMLEESLDTILKIWSSNPPYDIQGEFWTTQIKKSISAELGLGEMPKPFQQPHPEICLPSASPNSATVRLAGRRGWSFVTSSLLPPKLVATQWTEYLRGCEEGGHTPDGARWRLSRNIFVAGTDEEARRRIMDERSAYQHYLGYMRTVFKNIGKLDALKSHPDMRDDEITVNGIIEERVIFGSPQTVAQKLLAIREICGPVGTFLVTGADWSGPNEEWESESLRRLAKEVMPLVNAGEKSVRFAAE